MENSNAKPFSYINASFVDAKYFNFFKLKLKLIKRGGELEKCLKEGSFFFMILL